MPDPAAALLARIAEMEAVEKAATPRPWFMNLNAKGGEGDPAIFFKHPDLGKTAILCDSTFWNGNDDTFILASRAFVPGSLAALRIAVEALTEGWLGTDGVPMKTLAWTLHDIAVRTSCDEDRAFLEGTADSIESALQSMSAALAGEKETTR